jgi:general stress protein 26
MTVNTDKEQNLFDLIKDFDTAFLMTKAGDGRMHGRPMAVAKLERDSDLYFVGDVTSPKVEEIKSDPQVTATFQSSNQFATVSGRAEIVRDQAVIDELFSEAWEVWFPKGKNDPNLCLIRIEGSEAEYWDNAGVQGLKYMFKAAKAYLQGTKPDVASDQHGKVKL